MHAISQKLRACEGLGREAYGKQIGIALGVLAWSDLPSWFAQFETARRRATWLLYQAQRTMPNGCCLTANYLCVTWLVLFVLNSTRAWGCWKMPVVQGMAYLRRQNLALVPRLKLLCQ